MKYILVMAINRGKQSVLETEVFYTAEGANAAKEKFMDGINKAQIGGFVRVFEEKLFTIESLFHELLKVDPISDPEVLLARATKAHNLIYP